MALWIEEELPTPPWVKSLLLHLFWDVIDLTAFVWWFASYTPHIVETDKADFTAICMITMVIGAILVVGGSAVACCTRIEDSIDKIKRMKTYTELVPYEAVQTKLKEILSWNLEQANLLDAEAEVLLADKSLTDQQMVDRAHDIKRRHEELRAETERRAAEARGYEPAKDFCSKWIHPDAKHPFSNIVRHYAIAEVLYDMWQFFVLWWLVEAKHAGLTEDRWNGKVIVDLVNVLTTVIDVFLWKGPSVINTVWDKVRNS